MLTPEIYMPRMPATMVCVSDFLVVRKRVRLPMPGVCIYTLFRKTDISSDGNTGRNLYLSNEINPSISAWRTLSRATRNNEPSKHDTDI